jgi:hypothetical protein
MEISEEQYRALVKAVNVISQQGAVGNAAIVNLAERLSETGMWMDFQDQFIEYMGAMSTQITAIEDLLGALMALQTSSIAKETKH